LAIVGHCCGVDGVIYELEGWRMVLEKGNLIIQWDGLVEVVG
jgi:hypothetical protein